MIGERTSIINTIIDLIIIPQKSKFSQNCLFTTSHTTQKTKKSPVLGLSDSYKWEFTGRLSQIAKSVLLLARGMVSCFRETVVFDTEQGDSCQRINLRAY